MFWFILAILGTIGLFFVLCYLFGEFRPKCFLALLALLIAAVGCFASIPTGFTGVLTTFGKVEDTTLEAGLRLKSPWQEVILIDNREQKVSFTLSAFSSDIQQVDTVGSVNFNVAKSTAMDLYREVGVNYANILITPRLSENTKAVFAKYSAENLVVNRDLLSTEILALMRTDLEPYGINVISVAVEDIDFTDSFTNAVEAKQVAAQDKLTAQTRQEQKTMEAEAEAERKRINAEAEAQRTIIESEAAAKVKQIDADAAAYSTRVTAEAEAEANEKLSKSITDNLIDWNESNRWNGAMPQIVLGSNGAVPVLNLIE